MSCFDSIDRTKLKEMLRSRVADESFMRLVGFAPGATVIKQGDEQETGYMLLLLSGEVSVQTLDGGLYALAL